MKTAFCRAWLKKAEEIAEKTPAKLSFARWLRSLASAIFGAHRSSFFMTKPILKSFGREIVQNNGGYHWKKESRSFIKERFIATHLKETGYKETILEDSVLKKCDRWFYSKDC